MDKELAKILEKNSNISRPVKANVHATRYPTLNRVLGEGIACGTVVELWGEPGCGKTTFCLQEEVEILKQGKAVIHFDLEHALAKLPTTYLNSLGLKVDKQDGILKWGYDNFIYIEPTEGSHDSDLQTIIDAVRTGKVGMVVIDSIAQLDASPERGMNKQEQADAPKFIKRFLRKIVDLLAAHDTILIMINQITMEMNRMYTRETTPGGHNPKFITWARIRFGKPHDINDKGEEISQELENAVGFVVKVVAKKTRGGRPHMETTLKFNYDQGFDRAYDVIQDMIKTGKIIKSGAWYEYNKKKFQGLQAVVKYIEKEETK
jgi:RecA/RadA recombinase